VLFLQTQPQDVPAPLVLRQQLLLVDGLTLPDGLT
jgi:hypothetical protein